jgi:hypothetical protein
MICFSMLINHTSLIVEILEDPKYHFFLLSSKQNQTQRHKGTFDGDEFRAIKR